jgi:hypothetical protein
MMNYSKQIISIVLLLIVSLASGAFAAHNVKDETTARNNKRQRGWYIRLVSESDGLKDNKTVFGYLQGASDQKDRYDSEALSSGGSHYIYTTINHPDFEGAEEYRSDYRTFHKIGEKAAMWIIDVHSGDAYADITIHWDGVTKVKKKKQGDFVEKHKRGKRILGKMILLDEKNDLTIDVKVNNSYTFNMNGKREHLLAWILKKDGMSEDELAVLFQTYDNICSNKEMEEDTDISGGDFIAPNPRKK